MAEEFCQSCGMPLGADEAVYGTNADGSLNEDYCIYCYEQGAFTEQVTMDEMIERCLPFMVAGNDGMREDEALEMMREFFPMLKRWRQGAAG